MVQNRKENYYHDKIPYNLKGDLFFIAHIINVERNSSSFGEIILKVKLTLREFHLTDTSTWVK